jgi:hypothetical protein
MANEPFSLFLCELGAQGIQIQLELEVRRWLKENGAPVLGIVRTTPGTEEGTNLMRASLPFEPWEIPHGKSQEMTAGQASSSILVAWPLLVKGWCQSKVIFCMFGKDDFEDTCKVNWHSSSIYWGHLIG